MTITAYSVLLYIVLAIFLFCYFTATRVWIKVDERNRSLSKNFCKNLLAIKRNKADNTITITAILAPDNPLV